MTKIREFVSWDKTLTLILMVGIVMVIVYAVSQPKPYATTAICLFLAGAAGAAGAFIGFLFGIPRSLQKEPQTGAPSTAVQTPARDFAVNTNLEQISDWLTKIIVGVGLVELKNLPHRARLLAEDLSRSFGADVIPSGIVLSIGFFFAVFSFLLGYLWTRLYLASEFSKAEREAREKPEYVEGLIHALLYQPMPDGFTNAIGAAVEYNKINSSNERVWEYLACAYAQQYEYLNRAPKPDAQKIKEAHDNALEAIQRALQINPNGRGFLAAMWDPKQADPGEDDLVGFYNDSDFKRLLADPPLWTIVEAEVKNAGLTIAANCEALLKTLVARGEEEVLKCPNRRSEAGANLRRFLSAMISDARQKGYPELHEDTFDAAKRTICPLWPFC